MGRTCAYQGRPGMRGSVSPVVVPFGTPRPVRQSVQVKRTRRSLSLRPLYVERNMESELLGASPVVGHG